MIADPSGYTLDFHLYCGKQRTIPLSANGLAYDVVMELIKPFANQGYLVFFDNFYTSPKLVNDLEKIGIGATGTLRINRSGVSDAVKKLVEALRKRDVPRRTGYYIREQGSKNVYCCWRDNDCVTVLSSAYPGHSESTTKRRGKDQSGQYATLEVPLPSPIDHYNRFMGGVDLSDQLIRYHPILRQAKRYWKTLLYHLIEIAATNAFILHKWQCVQEGKKPTTESSFRDTLVLAIIETHGTGYVLALDNVFAVRHCSMAVKHANRRRCVVCHRRSSRQCSDCPFSPSLCQMFNRDCHGKWHSQNFAVQRSRYFASQKRKADGVLPCIPSKRQVGRPVGARKRLRKRIYS